MSETLQVVNNEAKHRFEIALGDDVAFAEYSLVQGGIILPHTEVPEEYEGQGIATQLVRSALDSVRARHLRVVALCPYVRAFLRRHEDEYMDLVGHTPAPPEA